MRVRLAGAVITVPAAWLAAFLATNPGAVVIDDDDEKAVHGPARDKMQRPAEDKGA